MKGLIAFITLFSLLLFASTIESRLEPGDYQRYVMEDDQFPEATKNLLIHSALKPLLAEKNKGCHETLKPEEEKSFVKDIKPQPNNVEAKESSTKDAYWGKVDPQNENPFAENIEPRPNLSVYNN